MNIDEIHARIQASQKEIRELRQIFTNELKQMERYEEISDEMKRLREERKSLENELKAGYTTEMDRIDDLKLEIETDKELLADMALNMYVDNQNVEIVDEYDNRWVPQFSVKFKKE